MPFYRVTAPIFVILLGICTTVFAGDPLSTSLENRTAILRSIGITEGPILLKTEIPGLYKEVESIFAKVTAAHDKLKPQDIVAINEVYIFDSPDDSAFVVALKEVGSPKGVNMVFVARGLIDHIFSSQQKRGQLPSWTPLKGILSHEMSHPREFYEEEGVRGQAKRTEGELKAREAASQLMEDRADADALDLQREAGFPPDSLLQGLEILGEKEQFNFLTLIDRANSTHPEYSRRVTQQRLLITLKRYESGTYEVEKSKPVPATVIAELKRLQLKWKFKEPKSIAETLNRLESIATAGDISDRFRSLEFNRLLVTLGDQILQTPLAKISPESRTKLRGFLLDLWFEDNLENRKYPNPIKKEKLDGLLSDVDGAGYWSKKPHFLSAVQRSEFFNSAEQVAWAKKQFVESFERAKTSVVGLQRRGALFTQWLYWAPLSSFLNDPQFKSWVLSNRENTQSVFYAIGNRNYRVRSIENWKPAFDLPTDLHIHFAHWFMKECYPSLTPTEKIRLIRFFVKTNFWGTFQEHSKRNDKFFEQLPGIGSHRGDLMFDPRREKTELRKKAREMAEWVWQDRAFFALFADTTRVNWNYVFELLGIDKATGTNALKKSIREFTLSDRYVEFLRELKSVKEDRDNSTQDFIVKAPGLPQDWATEDLMPYLGGDKNPKIANDPELRAIANRRMRLVVFAYHPDIALNAYARQLKQRLKGLQHLDLVALDTMDLEIKENILRVNPKDHRWGPAELDLALVRAILDSNLDFEDKKKLTRAILFEVYPQGGLTIVGAYKPNWISERENNIHRRISELILEKKIVTDYVEIIELLVDDPKFYLAYAVRGYYDDHDKLFMTLHDLHVEVIGALQTRWRATRTRTERLALASKMINKFLDPGVGTHYGNLKKPSKFHNAPGVSKIRGALAALLVDSGELSFQEAKNIFLRLTMSGVTEETDLFFATFLQPELEKPLSAENLRFLENVLQRRRLRNSQNLTQIADRLMKPQIESAFAKPLTPQNTTNVLDVLAEKIQNLYPAAQKARDNALEALGWRAKLEWKVDAERNAYRPAAELRALIESRKSGNYRRISPELATQASAFAALVASLEEHQRLVLLEYFLAKGAKPFPDTIRVAIENKVYDSSIIQFRRKCPDCTLASREFRLMAKKVSGEIQMLIETNVATASAFERIPLYELILTAGRPHAPADHPQFPLNVTRPLLDYEPDSMKEILLLSFLDSLKEIKRGFEIPPTIAYLLSQFGQDESILELFSVFQTVGIKGGQLTAVFKILGEKIAEQTANLQDSAEPLTLEQIQRIFEAELSQEEKALIKAPVKILGSASAKVVVLVELRDGSHTVALIRRPNAPAQVAFNMEFVKIFLKKLDQRLRQTKKDYNLPVGALSLILRDLEIQMQTEIDFTKEKLNIDEFKRLLESYNSRWSDSERNGFAIHVPDTDTRFKVRSGLMFLEEGRGKTWRKLKESADEMWRSSGELVVKISLDMLFRFGVFNADQHAGQQLVRRADAPGAMPEEYPRLKDPVKQDRVTFLDFGQGVRFKRSMLPWQDDDRVTFAKFLLAADQLDIKGIAREVQQMQSEESSVELNKIEDAVAHALQKAEDAVAAAKSRNQTVELIPALIQQILNEVAVHEFLFKPQFSVGAFKGLLILEGQGFVSSAEFRKILRSQIQTILLKRSPITAVNYLLGSTCSQKLKPAAPVTHP